MNGRLSGTDTMVSQPARRAAFAATFVAVLAVAVLNPHAEDKSRKPSLSLKATPPISFSPARIRLLAELRGGANDYEDYYCPSIEWDWGDDTKSESSTDCEPYEAGKSEIRRRFTAEHVYHNSGSYRVQFRLKRKDKAIANASATVQVRAGLRDISQ